MRVKNKSNNEMNNDNSTTKAAGSYLAALMAVFLVVGAAASFLALAATMTPFVGILVGLSVATSVVSGGAAVFSALLDARIARTTDPQALARLKSWQSMSKTVSGASLGLAAGLICIPMFLGALGIVFGGSALLPFAKSLSLIGLAGSTSMMMAFGADYIRKVAPILALSVSNLIARLKNRFISNDDALLAANVNNAVVAATSKDQVAAAIEAAPASAGSSPMAALLSQDKDALEQHIVAAEAGRAISGVSSDVVAAADAVAAAVAVDANASSQSHEVEMSEMPSVPDSAPSDQPAPSLTPAPQAKPEPAPALSLQPPMPQPGRRAELLPQ